MSFWARLWGSPDAVKDVIDVVRDAGDALFYTKEEQAADRASDTTEARNVFLEWIKNSQGQNLARRVIAFAIAGAWLVIKLAGSGLAIAAIWSDSSSDDIAKSSDILDQFSSDMTPAVMLILGFYFAAPHMGRIAEAALISFGKSNGNK